MITGWNLIIFFFLDLSSRVECATSLLPRYILSSLFRCSPFRLLLMQRSSIFVCNSDCLFLGKSDLLAIILVVLGRKRYFQSITNCKKCLTNCILLFFILLLADLCRGKAVFISNSNGAIIIIENMAFAVGHEYHLQQSRQKRLEYPSIDFLQLHSTPYLPYEMHIASDSY